MLQAFVDFVAARAFFAAHFSLNSPPCFLSRFRRLGRYLEESRGAKYQKMVFWEDAGKLDLNTSSSLLARFCCSTLSFPALVFTWLPAKDVVVIYDKYPKARCHLLMLPKKGKTTANKVADLSTRFGSK